MEADNHNDSKKQARCLPWILGGITILLSLCLAYCLGHSPLRPYSEVEGIVKEEVERQMFEQDSILAEQIKADSAKVSINIDRCKVDDCTMSEIKYYISESSRETLGQYINEENNHLTWIAIIITALVSIIGIGVPLFFNSEIKRRIEKNDVDMKVHEKKMEELEKRMKVHEASMQNHEKMIKETSRFAEDTRRDVEDAKKKINTILSGSIKGKGSAEELGDEDRLGETQKNKTKDKISDYFAKALKEEDPDKRIKLYTEILKLRAGHKSSLNNRGNAYANKGEYDKAIADYSEAIRLYPGYGRAYINRGRAYGKIGQKDKAVDDFNKAINIATDDATAYFNRGYFYDNNGDVDLAIADYSKAIEINPDYAEALYNRGLLYDDKEKYNEAIADFTAILKIKSDDADAYYNRGNSYVHIGEYSKAVDDYTKLVQLRPDAASSYHNLGVAYQELGNHDNAIANISKAIKLSPENAKSYYVRGLSYALQNKIEMAMDDMEKAESLDENEHNYIFGLEMVRLLIQIKEQMTKGNLKEARKLAANGLNKSNDANDEDWIKIMTKQIGDIK